MNEINPSELLRKYLEGNSTPEETAILETWYFRYEDQSLSAVDAQERVKQLDSIRNVLVSISNSSDYHQNVPNLGNGRIRHLSSLKKMVAVAAALIICFGLGLFYYSKSSFDPHRPQFTQDILPGSNGAVLTLANGKQIYINDEAEGNLAVESGVKISKTKDGVITYQLQNASGNAAQNNSLETRNGEQTQLILPDHSKVWLNSGSIIRYPSSFAAMKVRRIELTGEAYFEVAKDAAHPFIVKTSLQEVRVLGTHFNVNSYQDEPKIKTTLLEGSVKVISGQSKVILKPGEQASIKSPQLQSAKTSGRSGLKANDVEVTRADMKEVMAWKNGYFRFEGEPLESVMRKVSRWYNIRVIYDASVPRNILLGGFISRKKNLSAVLEMMTRTEDVKFKIDGNKVTVLRY